MTAPAHTSTETSPEPGLEEETLSRPAWSFSGRRGRAVPAPAQPAEPASPDPSDQTSSQRAYVRAHARETEGTSMTATVQSSRESTIATLRRLLIGPPAPDRTRVPATVLRAQTAGPVVNEPTTPANVTSANVTSDNVTSDNATPDNATPDIATPDNATPAFTVDEREMPVIDVTFELGPEAPVEPTPREATPVATSAPAAAAPAAAAVAPKVASDAALRAITPPNVRRTMTAAGPSESELRERIATKREHLQTLLRQLDV